MRAGYHGLVDKAHDSGDGGPRFDSWPFFAFFPFFFLVLLIALCALSPNGLE